MKWFFACIVPPLYYNGFSYFLLAKSSITDIIHFGLYFTCSREWTSFLFAYDFMSHWQVKWDTVLTIKHFEEPIDQAEKVTIKVAVADIVHNSNFARVNGVLCLLLLCSRIVDSTSLLLFFYSTWLKLQRLPNSIKWDKVDQKISKFWISERWRLWNQTSIDTDFPDL